MWTDDSLMARKWCSLFLALGGRYFLSGKLAFGLFTGCIANKRLGFFSQREVITKVFAPI